MFFHMFSITMQEFAAKALEEEQDRMRAELEAENEEIRAHLQERAQVQVDAAMTALREQNEREQATFRLHVQVRS